MTSNFRTPHIGIIETDTSDHSTQFPRTKLSKSKIATNDPWVTSDHSWIQHMHHQWILNSDVTNLPWSSKSQWWYAMHGLHLGPKYCGSNMGNPIWALSNIWAPSGAQVLWVKYGQSHMGNIMGFIRGPKYRGSNVGYPICEIYGLHMGIGSYILCINSYLSNIQ